MKSYELNGNLKTGYALKEKNSNNVIDGFKSYEEARKASKFFSGGGGFSGWTPEFITKKIQVKAV